MKKAFLIFLAITATYYSYGQTNQIQSTGNVGIGTTSPATLLQVGSSTTRGAINIIDGTGVLPALSLTNAASGGHQFTFYGGASGAGNLDLYDQTAAAYRMTILSNGNIGIGTTSPGAKLDVNGVIRTVPASGLFFDNAANFWRISQTVTGLSGKLQFTQDGVADIFTLQGNGNIGIGTTSPSAFLHVFTSVAGMNTQLAKFEYLQPGARGSGYISILSGTRTTDIEQNSGDGTFRFGTYMDSNIVNNYSASEGGYGNINFVTGNAGGSSVAMTIGGGTQKGNIGIGTTDPHGYKLAVNGSAIATSVTVKLYANWPDYVFNKNYKLPTLAEVKTYIDKNHHLPEIPSEQQIIKEGLNLGEMNKLLVKKVEELTLYLIEKDNKDKDQSTQLKAQQEQINKLQQQLNASIKTSGK